MKAIRIGTRSSRLALWQAAQVEALIREAGYPTIIQEVHSHGDIDLHTPIYELGIQGVFTKTLDIALLNKDADIAVHSYKDVPTLLAHGLQVAAVLPRENPFDMLICKNSNGEINTLATSSLRRSAQWLNKYPGCKVENVRGNVQTRLKKFSDEQWDAIIFAAAGLERLGLVPQEHATILHWMLPAPAQGAIVLVCRKDDEETKALCAQFNHTETEHCTTIEREFLKHLQGGCSAPVGAYARHENGRIHFNGNVLSLDGKTKLEVEEIFDEDQADVAGLIMAKVIIGQGGDKLVGKR